MGLGLSLSELKLPYTLVRPTEPILGTEFKSIGE